MKRLFRRPQQASKTTREEPPREPQSEADLDYTASRGERGAMGDAQAALAPRYGSVEGRLHTRAWSLESDLRISRVVLSPLLPWELHPDNLPKTYPRWSPLLPCSVKLPGLPSESAFPSPTCSQDDQHSSQYALPSWPSSVICKQDLCDSAGVGHSAMLDSPASLLSYQATENSYSPIRESFTTPGILYSSPGAYCLTSTPKHTVMQVDEFGRMISTLEAAVGEKAQEQSIQPPLLHGSALPLRPSASITSRDTFGVRLEEGQACLKEGQSDGSSDFSVQPGTPLLLASSQPLLTGRRECIRLWPSTRSSAEEAAHSRQGTARVLLHQPCHAGNQPASFALLSPFVLDCERHSGTATAPRVYQQDIQFEPWRSSRLVASASQAALMHPAKKHTHSRPRAVTIIDGRCPPPAFPNPHTSEQPTPVWSAGTPRLGLQNSANKSRATVQSIINQQRQAMDKLATAGFWQQKTLERKVNSEKEDELRRLPPVVPQEEIVAKVSLWAWLLSSEPDRSEDEEDALEVLRSSSPALHLAEKGSVEEVEGEGEAGKSWEWLACEDDLVDDSFESNGEASTVQGHEEAGEQGSTVGLGLQQGMCVEVVEEGAVVGDADAAPLSPFIGTPDLGQRESRTTAAIEALLAQMQQSGEPTAARFPARTLGTSYLYQQILQSISEEAGKAERDT